MKRSVEAVDKHALWKWLILIALTAWSLVLVTPLHEKVKLGLDLRGGTSFVLEVDTSELSADAAKDAQARALEVIRNRVDAMGVSEPIIYPEPRSNRIIVQIPGLKAADRDRAVKNLKRAAFLEFRMVHPRNDKLIDQLFEKGLAPPGYKIVTLDEQAMDGRWVRRNYYKKDETRIPEGLSEADLRKRLHMFHAPAGYELLLKEEHKQGQSLYVPYYVSRRRELTGEHLRDAGIDYQRLGQPIVTLKFDAKGARKFARVTSDYAPGGAKNPSPQGRRYLAIVLDGTLYSAPFIKTPIHGGEAIIEGDFSLKEAQDLAIVLRAGALPAPVHLVEERGVDPSLGRDSIESGKIAAIYGAVAVLLFMLIYYRLAGFIADLALALDLLLLPLGMMVAAGFLGLFTGGAKLGGGQISLPTLTLPGIAGLVLTAGMAVDANVLIFERIREELRTGKRLLSAISGGYDKAFRTIFDANITTLLTAVILFWQGSGPVRGFAVTLSAGIIVSMYTALVATRLFFNVLVTRFGLSRLSMLTMIRNANFDFLGKRLLAGALSLLIIIGTWTVFVMKGNANLGVDFTGGKALTFVFSEKVPVDDLRATLKAAGIDEVQIQYLREMAAVEGGHAKEYLEVKVGFEEGDRARKILLEKFGAKGFRVVKEDSVGPQVGRELQRKGVTAIIAALIGIVIYLSIRFEFGFAMGAIVALAHDVLITVGVYCLMGRQLSLPIVAALLTIVGYSVNDTIVVFDRIRENLRLMRGKSYTETANSSINQTLSRTLLTSLTTLLSVTMLLVFGGGAIHDFALTLFIGIVVGTYSSIYVATPVAMLWHSGEKTTA